MSGGKKRTLILCVDRDDDLGAKALVETPVIGRDETLRAATKLAMSDPEEADANAMFEAVRLYEQLTATADKDEEYEVAVITGSPAGGIKADRKLLSEFEKVLGAFPANGIILVSDGYMDETVIPLIQSRAPIVSVKRVVVRHSKSIEETAALFSRYMKLVLENPRYSRIVLGLPGALILVLLLLWALNLLVYAWIALMLGLGTFMCIKGFKLDYYIGRALRAIRKKVFKFPSPQTYLVAIPYAAGLLVILLGAYQVVWLLKFSTAPPATELISDPVRLIGWIFMNTSHIFIIGFSILIFGRCLHLFLNRDPIAWYALVGLIVCAWSYRLLYEVGRILVNPMLAYTDLITTIFTGIFITFIAAVAVNVMRARHPLAGRSYAGPKS